MLEKTEFFENIVDLCKERLSNKKDMIPTIFFNSKKDEEYEKLEMFTCPSSFIAIRRTIKKLRENHSKEVILIGSPKIIFVSSEEDYMNFRTGNVDEIARPETDDPKLNTLFEAIHNKVSILVYYESESGESFVSIYEVIKKGDITSFVELDGSFFNKILGFENFYQKANEVDTVEWWKRNW